MTTANRELHLRADAFQSLAPEEAETIVAGESLLYWVSYGVGVFCFTIMHSSGTQTSGQKAMNAALS